MKKASQKHGPGKIINNRQIVEEKLQNETALPNPVDTEITDAELAKREPSPDVKIYNVQDVYGNLKERVVEPKSPEIVSDPNPNPNPNPIPDAIPDSPVAKKVQFAETKPLEPIAEPKINTIKQEDPEAKKEEVNELDKVRQQNMQFLHDKLVKLDSFEQAGCDNIRMVTPNAASRKEPNVLMAESDIAVFGLSSAIVGVGGFLLLKWVCSALFGGSAKKQTPIKRKPQKRVVVVDESDTEPESDY